MARYGLARHVFVCRDEEYVVVLDLKKDRYFALEAAKTAPLATVLSGWPVAPSADLPATTQRAEEVAAPLLSRGWLVQKRAHGAYEPADSKDATPVCAPRPETDLIQDMQAAGASLNLRTVAAFVFASVLAKFVLRFWHFERVIRRVGERKSRCADSKQPLDLERIRQLVGAFNRMRVFLFSSREECLHDSLAVLEFLAQHGVFPTWVFGVRARPFAAHCWLQHAGIVLNDTVEHVSTYVPIMLV